MKQGIIMTILSASGNTHAMNSLVLKIIAPVLVLFLVAISQAQAQTSRAQAQNSSPVCLYSEPNFQGRSFCSSTNVSLVPLNFSASSVKIDKGYEVTLYRFPLFFGKSVVFNTDQADTRGAISDVSSLKLVEIIASNESKAAEIIPVISMLLLDGPSDPNDFDGDGLYIASFKRRNSAAKAAGLNVTA